MIASFDTYSRFETPIISLRKISGEYIGFLDNIKNIKTSFEFNAVSEISFDVYMGKDDAFFDVYNNIEVKHQLFIEDVGFFIMRTVEENISDEGNYKSITALSCEHELTYKEITYFKETYKFWDEENPSKTLMGMLLNSLPNWSIGHIDDEVKSKSRTFDEPKATIYSFMLDTVEESYECIFEFDIINRIINAYDKNNYLRKTNIFLTRKDILKNIKVATNSEDIFTALTLYGSDEINYSSVNPLGSSTIYDFNYYKNKMSNDLVWALNAWENKILNAENSIKPYRNEQATLEANLETVNSEIISIESQKDNAEKELSASTIDSDKASILKRISDAKQALAKAQASYNSIEKQKNNVSSNIRDICLSCSFDRNFTKDQLNELDTYIYASSSVDDTFALTNDMDYAEEQGIISDLYLKAKSMLKDISIPTEELTIDTNNFIFQKDFLPFTKQLDVGILIDVEINENLIVSYVLLRMDVDYQEKTISLTFGNKYRSSSALSAFDKWQSNVSASTSDLVYNRSKYGKAVNSGSLDKMNAFINSSLNLTLNQIKASDGQTLEITDSGIIGRRIDPDTGETDKEQIWLTSNNLAFTKDNWNTLSTAVGRIVMPDGNIGYGINAEYLIGKWILGNNMEISNTGGDFVINSDGLWSKRYDSSISNIQSELEQTNDAINLRITQLENEVGGNIIVYTVHEVPTFDNYPTCDWYEAVYPLNEEEIPKDDEVHYPGDYTWVIDDESCRKHLGSIAYLDGTEFTYKFIVDEKGEYAWKLMENTETSYILAKISQLQVTADGITSNVKQVTADLEKNYFNKTETSSQIAQTASSITQSVSATYTTKETTNKISGELALKIGKDENDQIVSMLNASANVIKLTANRIAITSDYFSIDNYGILTAKSGTIAGWNFNSKALYSGSDTYGKPGGRYFGIDGLSVGSVFMVDSSGKLTANSGTIAGWSFNSSALYSGFSSYGQTGGRYFGTGGLSISSLFMVDSSGNLTAKSGTIAGWSFNSTALYSGSDTYGRAGGRYFGTSGLSIGSAFTVSSTGQLYSENADIKGKITANSGSIAGWSINSNALYYGSAVHGDSGGRYFGSSGLSIGSAFKVNSSGVLTATGANLSGNFTMTGGSINIQSKSTGNSIRLGTSDSYIVIDYEELHLKSILGSTGIKGGILLMHSPTGATTCEIHDNSAKFYTPARFYATVYNSSGGYVFTSDLNAKKDIENLDINKSADFIYSLIPKKFKFREGGSDRLHHGFIAQEVKASMKDDDWGLYVDQAVSKKDLDCKEYDVNENGEVVVDGEIVPTKGLRDNELLADIVATLQSINNRLNILEREA